MIIFSFNTFVLKYCSFTAHVFHSRCGDYIWVSGVYGHCTIEGKTLSIEDITKNVLQSLIGKWFSVQALQDQLFYSIKWPKSKCKKSTVEQFTWSQRYIYMYSCNPYLYNTVTSGSVMQTPLCCRQLTWFQGYKNSTISTSIIHIPLALLQTVLLVPRIQKFIQSLPLC